MHTSSIPLQLWTLEVKNWFHEQNAQLCIALEVVDVQGMEQGRQGNWTCWQAEARSDGTGASAQDIFAIYDELIDTLTSSRMSFFDCWIYEVSHLASIHENHIAGLMTVGSSWQLEWWHIEYRTYTLWQHMHLSCPFGCSISWPNLGRFPSSTWDPHVRLWVSPNLSWMSQNQR